LIDMGADGGPADFEAVFRRLYPRARGVAHRITGDPTTAEDAAAEAFARALVSWRRVASLPYLDAWVLRVTANVAVDIVRRRVPDLGAAEPAPAPDDVVVLRIALGAALAALPRRQREVIALHHLVGLREDEVARSLGVSVGSVKRHGHRAMTRLRSVLGADWDWSREEGVAGVAI
jgi:RNA polymerase sigma factor (sigma-70 family)